MTTEEKIYCETPAEGKAGTHIPKWKYLAVRNAICAALRSAGKDGIAFAALSDAVRKELSETDLKALGSVAWHVTTVKLDMEVKGDIKRVTGKSPQWIMQK